MTQHSPPPGSSSDEIRVNVGCGHSTIDGFINCDCSPGPTVDVVFDAQKPWPFPTDSITEIYCSHTLEHLPDHMAFFRESWKVLKPLGTILIRVPYGHSTEAMADMTHLRPWYHTSFASLQPGYDKVAKGNHYKDSSFPFWVIDTMILVRPWVMKLCRWPFGKRLAVFMIMYLNNIGRELWVSLQKTYDKESPDSSIRRAGAVPSCIGAWKHEMDGHVLQAGDVGFLMRMNLG